ncbi:ABC transporter ATP-binding protein [bacterium]|nr:ABC transporter ATP-binding protein [candidate division CSSED10-310 bacterium]
MSDNAIIRGAALRFNYGRREVLRGIDLRIGAGEFTGIIGPNGSGKSTLVKILTGFERPSSGSVSIDNRDIRSVSRRAAARLTALVPQSTAFYFPYTVHEFVMMGRHPYTGLAGIMTPDDEAAVRRAMDETHTWELRDRSVLALSGGEQQRAVLAAALAQETKILFLDEPTASLDMFHQVEIYQTLRRLNRERGLTVAAVTHDLNLGAMFCRRLILLVDGRIAADGPPAAILTPEIIARHYGVRVQAGINAATGVPFVVPLGERAQ